MTANNEGPTEKIGVLFQRELISISLFCSSVPQGGALLKNCTFSSRLSSYFKSWMGMTFFFISFYYCSSKERKAFLGNPSSVIIAPIVFDLFTPLLMYLVHVWGILSERNLEWITAYH